MTESSALVVCGPPQEEVGHFSDWVVSELRNERRGVYTWDFSTSHGLEAAYVFEELASALPSRPAFDGELKRLKDEFVLATRPLNLEIGRGAKAGGNQSIQAHVESPNLPEYLNRNVNRLGRAFFQDIAARTESIGLVISGLEIGRPDFDVPLKGFRDAIISTIMRPALDCDPLRLVVVLAVTFHRGYGGEIPERFKRLELGSISIQDAGTAIALAVPGLSRGEADSAAMIISDGRSASTSYAMLRNGIANLALLHAENQRRDVGNG